MKNKIQVENMAIRSFIKKVQKPRDSITKRIKMITTRNTNSMIAKKRKVTTRNMVANMNSMNLKREITKKARNMILATMKDTKVIKYFLT